MTYYAITGHAGLMWLGEAMTARDAVRAHMIDIGADEYTDSYVWRIPDPPAGWDNADPAGWICGWVEDVGKREHVADQVRIGSAIYDWDAVVNLMDAAILEDMDTAGEYTSGIGLSEFFARYCRRHREKFGEEFVVN